MVRLMWILGSLCLVACTPNKPGNNAETDVFEGLSDVTPGLSSVSSDVPISLPRDHGTHDDFAIEWWYLTANLSDQQGREYALQWTLFRFNNGMQATPWASGQQFMGHAKIRSAQNHWFEERFARGDVGNVAVTTPPFSAFLDDWHWRAEGADLFPATLAFTLNQSVSATLSMTAPSRYTFHGDNGVSIKLRDGSQASYYYSQPFIEIAGTLALPEETVEISGQGWFDHEWTSQYLTTETSGWDWFSLHLANGDKVMLFNMRHEQQPDFWSGSYIRSDGQRVGLSEKQIQAQVLEYKVVQERRFPLRWAIALPEQDLALQVEAVWDDQYNPGLLSYYEGAVKVSGTVSGRGFIELTGYPRLP